MRRFAPWVAAALALFVAIQVEFGFTQQQQQACGGICQTLQHAHVYWTGGDPFWNPSMVWDQPLCPVQSNSMYTMAYLWVLAPLAEHIGAVCNVWPYVQLAAYATALVAAASLLSGWRRAAMLAVVTLTRGWLGDPFYVDYAVGQIASIEAALLWGSAALVVRECWWGAAALTWILGLPKQVYWVGLALPSFAQRYRVTAVGVLAVAGLHLTMWRSNPSWYAELLHNAGRHDERGAIHPALRSAAHDLSDALGQGNQVGDVGWGLVVLAVGAALWVWARRFPQRVASGQGLLLFVLAYLAVTPYLKDYTLVAALPAIASVLVTAHPVGVAALLLVQYASGTLWGYHALALVWTALLAQAWQVTRPDAEAAA